MRKNTELKISQKYCQKKSIGPVSIRTPNEETQKLEFG